MIKKQIILIAACIIGLGACKPALTRKYSLKEPCVETLESVRKELATYSPDYCSYLCVFRDSASLVDWFKNKHLPGRSQFYNSAGYRIVTQDSTFCSGVETDFAGNLKISQTYSIDSLITIEKLTKNLLPAGEKVSLDPSGYTFTCVIFWAKFMGKINKASFEIANSAMNSMPAKKGQVNVLFVDMDIMVFWNVSGSMIRTKTN